MRRLVSALFLVLSCHGPEKAPVVATLPPLAAIARAVAGDQVEVRGVVPPGANPHTYEPTPRTVAVLTSARVVIYAGDLLEPWVSGVLGPDQKLVDASVSGNMKGKDPHVWLDPERAKLIARDISQALSETWPEKKAVFEANLRDFNARVDSFDAWFRGQLEKVEDKRYVSVHPAWRYFSARYGLTEVASLGIISGGEVSPGQIREVVEAMNAGNIRAVFGSGRGNPPYVNTLKSEAGARVALLDPLGDPDDSLRADYISLLFYNAREMLRVMR